MRKISEEERVKIVETLIKHGGGGYEATARELHLSTRIVQWVDIVANRKFGYTDAGRGRPELQEFIIGIRDLAECGGWDNSETKIKNARQDYDDGKIEMCTGRDGMNCILYAIPRRNPIIRKPWFKTNVVVLEVAHVQAGAN